MLVNDSANDFASVAISQSFAELAPDSFAQ